MVVSVPWESQSNVWWNETCANIIEHFGLPGEKYVTKLDEHQMDFIFYDDRDALMCKILVSDLI
jgi:excinuclease UvrABC ATPase subunit